MTHGAKGEENMRLQVPEERALGGGAWMGPDATQVAFPLGGIGTGNISLGARGDLRDVEIWNEPRKGLVLPFTHFTLWAQADGAASVTRVLEGGKESDWKKFEAYLKTVSLGDGAGLRFLSEGITSP